MSELRRCPFCGGEAQVNERYRGGIPNRKMYWVSCKACGVAQLHNDLSGYRYQSKAIDRWNRRKPIDRIVEQLEEMHNEIPDDYWLTAIKVHECIDIVKKGGLEGDHIADVGKMVEGDKE